jgi:hypothetical protein
MKNPVFSTYMAVSACVALAELNNCSLSRSTVNMSLILVRRTYAYGGNITPKSFTGWLLLDCIMILVI